MLLIGEHSSLNLSSVCVYSFTSDDFNPWQSITTELATTVSLPTERFWRPSPLELVLGKTWNCTWREGLALHPKIRQCARQSWYQNEGTSIKGIRCKCVYYMKMNQRWPSFPLGFIIYSVIYIISAVASPVFGFCVDKTGRNIFWVIAGITITLGCHTLLAFTFINPYIPVVSIYVDNECMDIST